ncbi:hypothetical protein L1987_11866 [Smallanthus sonchifolius]|uniref:Uncharacterized protein n=1 Tax=Smallanthus sonchifolius TaxID=185202 RepID=A0ACB9JC70_9ASTR|nr:hypothetical protein L1987_11866 [Smallanthus sonchifolius]
MKDLSFFLPKNTLAFKMKKGFNNSTSTLDHPQTGTNQQQPSLEEMIMQLDLETSRSPRLLHRMSCVVGKLMGLEAMPIPVRLKHRMMMNTRLLRKQNLRRSSEIQTSERRKVDSNRGSCSRATISGHKPVAVEIASASDELSWPMSRFL